MREDPSSLSPDVLYPIIDATTVKRTRQFVKKHYAGDTITGPDGKPTPIVFPQPRAISVRYNLHDLLPGFFDRLESSLDQNNANAITFVRYMPGAYLLSGGDAEENSRTRAMVGLLRSGLLKRFESSAFAFRKTVEKMVREHGVFLDALDAGYIVTTDFMKELSADDEGLFEDLLTATEHRTDAALYDISRLRAAVEHDRDLLQALVDEAATITADSDPKLKALVIALVEIANQAESEATDAIDEAQKRKVFDRYHTSVRGILARTGGVRPRERRRSRRVLTLSEREHISRGIVAGDSIRSIAMSLGRAPSTVSREIKRNGGCRRYRACRADQAAWERAKRPKPCKLVINRALARLVAKKLRALWSPEQIAGWSKCTYPNDEGYQVSHETIYKSLFIQARGALKKELLQHLRRTRVPYATQGMLTRKGMGTGVRKWPIISASPWRQISRCTSAIRKALGSGVLTRTPMAC
jgi:hypothetical protein